MEQITYGKTTWRGEKDCSLQGKIARTTSGIEMEFFILDDSIVEQTSEQEKGEFLELYLDIRPVRLQVHNFYEKGVFKINIYPFSKEKISFFPLTYPIEIHKIIVKTSIIKNKGYEVKIQIEEAEIMKNHYSLRKQIGFDVSINDVDKKVRKTQMTYSGNADSWQFPHLFKRIELED